MLIVNEAVFLHIHKLDDGTIIEHAHPYNKSADSQPLKSHHHTNAERLFFQHLKVLFLVTFLTLVLFTLVIKEKVTFGLITNHAYNCINLQEGRAPPLS